ncbi:hypothetical protein DL96DRAFT_1736440 [Flagelloscypha sp. PMI_526]|nr:hypothetical protein DL96DRAFT_1736440 [Flagelloscypha sp. PMI_526]
MSSNRLPPPEVIKNIVPSLLGSLLEWFLHKYTVTFPKDRLALKSLIYFLFVIETSKTLLSTYYILDTYGSNYGVYTQLSKLGVTWLSVPIMTSLVSGTVQLFLTWRILTLGKSWVIAAPIAMIALIHSGAGITTGVYSAIADDATKLRYGSIRISGVVWIVSGTCGDVIIALTTVFLVLPLYPDRILLLNESQLTRMRTGFQKTSMVLDRLILMSIETGTVTAIAEVVMLGLFFGFQSTSYFSVISNCLSKLYSNNLILIQNSRETSRADLSTSAYASQPSAFVAAHPTGAESMMLSFNDGTHYRPHSMSSSRKPVPVNDYV